MTEPKESDEDILNVIRTAEKDRLATTEIAEELSIGTRQTNNRLNEMDDRVVKEEVSGVWMWSLSDSEPSEFVEPDVAERVRRKERLYSIADIIGFIAKWVFIAGAVLIFAGFTAALQNSSVPLVTQEGLLATGYVALAVGAIAAMTAGTVKIVGYATVKAAKGNL